MASNDNPLDISEIESRLAWVRPVMTAMRAVRIPENVAQNTMEFLLRELDQHLDGDG